MGTQYKCVERRLMQTGVKKERLKSTICAPISINGKVKNKPKENKRNNKDKSRNQLNRKRIEQIE